MTEESRISPVQVAPLKSGPAPHVYGPPGIVSLPFTFLIAAIFPVMAGCMLFGWQAVRVLAISVAVSLLAEASVRAITRQMRSWSESHALLIGVLIALTMPASVSWQVAAVAAATSVLIGQALLGGVGNYLWHPVVVGRVITQTLFHDELTPARRPVLGPGRLLYGDLNDSAPLPAHSYWTLSDLPRGIDAWEVLRPVDVLRNPVPVEENANAIDALKSLMRDVLPPWPETLWGADGGGIGEACVLGAIAAGLFLMWRGYLRRQLVAGALVTYALLAAVLPLRFVDTAGMIGQAWFPGILTTDGWPIGFGYVCYLLTAGEFLLVVMLLAPDPSSSPLGGRGHLLFGMILGSLTIVLLVVVGIPAAAYWALLGANTCVPLIDRLTRRRVFGT